MEFKPWPKIIRLEKKRPAVFTEKIDGTNACVVISAEDPGDLRCQSRTRFISPEDDNYGFARWAMENYEELLKLGPGYHFGEWWGAGIQRGYDQTEKKFSLFNTRRWGEHNPETPKCCSVVPIIPAASWEEARNFLIQNGSLVAPGYMRPEGVMMYEPDTDTYFKIIIDK